MEDGATSGRQALARLLDSRQITARLLRLVLAVAVSQLIAVLVVEFTIEPNFDGPAVAWLGSLTHVALSIGAVLVFNGRSLRRELIRARDVVAAHEDEFQERTESQKFLRDVTDAFEMSESDTELFEAAGIALGMATVGGSELLVADASNAHLTRLVTGAGREAPSCGAVTPSSCPAVRRGKTMLFGDPNGLSSCPRLRERNLPDDAVAACIPVNVLGAPTAVLHSTCMEPLDSVALAVGVRRLEGIAVRFGSRLGLLRATARSRLQADSDPLTGLLNRRALENRTRELLLAEVPFSLAMLDLDNFKTLNDTYGHETGDRALRLFSRTLRTVMRDGDIVSRFGGEEFVVVLRDSDVTKAAPVMHRVRDQLRNELASAEVPMFSCSIGLVDSSDMPDYFSMLRAADQALLTAKATGRDRIVIGDTTERPELHVDMPSTPRFDGAEAVVVPIAQPGRGLRSAGRLNPI